MKYKIKRILALVMAIMLAVPAFGFAQDEGSVVIDDIGSGAFIDALDETVEVVGNLDLDPDLNVGELTLEDGDQDAADATLSPAFEQTQEYEGRGRRCGRGRAVRRVPG